MMDIPQGYKQTELGIIPEDWEVKPIGECLSIGNGCDYKNKSFGNIPVYGTGGIITYINDFLYDGQTICIGRKGTINKPLYYEGKIWTVDTLYYTYNFIGVDVKYIYYLLLTIDWMSLNEATGVPSLTSERIRHVLLALPPIAEQRAIAEALSDIDGLIAALDKKIAKKRLIKQGAMQQLLTGKKRLPGFTDPWEERELRAICDVLDNKRVPLNEEQRKKGIYPYCGANGIVDYINQYIFEEDLILIAEDGGNFDQFETRPISYWMTGKYWVNNHAHVLKAKSNYNQKYIFYQLEHKDITDYIVSGTRTKLTRAQLDKIRIVVPNSQLEQTAIATILSDMDKEIVDLEAKRDKYRLLKSGMMQKLLTGQIRLKC